MKTTPIISSDAVKLQVGKPVIIAQASPAVTAWGPYRMPVCYRHPNGALCLTFAAGADHYCDQGVPRQCFLSWDDGATWQESAWPTPMIGGVNPLLAPVLEGEFWGFAPGKGIEYDMARMPAPVASLGAGTMVWQLFRLRECPEDVRRWYAELPGLRWSPNSKEWTNENVQWDDQGQLVFAFLDVNQQIPGYWGQKQHMENSPVINGDELLMADYWTQYEDEQGNPPAAWECHLMVSKDNGRSWQRRGTITPHMPAGDGVAEPGLAMNQAGELVCVLRREYSTPDSLYPSNPTMYLLHSRDKGYTWSERQTLFDFGVYPRLLQLANGVLVLAFGRPGMWLSFSLDGGHSWTEPHAIMQVEPGKGSCGYPWLTPVGDDSFLLSYTDFEWPNAQGEPCKTVIVRRIEVEVKG